MRLRATVAGLLVALAAPAAARADALLPPAGHAFTGLSGSTSAAAFTAATGKAPAIFGVFVGWGSSDEYAFRAAESVGARLMLHVSTGGYGAPEVITPLDIARGHGDGYLLHLNARLAQEHAPTYVRLLAEMNQANNDYCAFDRDGRYRGRAHSTQSFKQAWRRATLIIRGGSVATIDARLQGLHLPPVATTATVLPKPQVAMAWVPQTAGSPDIPANSAQAYWPGARYVDWVGTDFYSRFPGWTGLERFYAEHPTKPFLFGEWALWGRDDPAFVEHLFAWMSSHRRVRMELYNQGRPGGPFRLSRYPRGAAALRSALRDPRWLGG